MTEFGDQLRASLKKKSEQLFARQMQEERLLAASKRLQDETRRAADRLYREVFGPLLQEFREVMEAAGVLCGGALELDDGGPGEYFCRYTGMGTAPGTPHFEIRIASVATQEGRIDMRVECLDATAAEFSDSHRESTGAGREQRRAAGKISDIKASRQERCGPERQPRRRPPVVRRPLEEVRRGRHGGG